MRQNSARLTGLTMLLLGLATSAMAGKVDPVYQHGGLAIRGYDPVAYYQQSAPVKGSSQFSYQWQGATWLFASAENRDRFQAEPEHYAPQYGGIAPMRSARAGRRRLTLRHGRLWMASFISTTAKGSKRSGSRMYQG